MSDRMNDLQEVFKEVFSFDGAISEGTQRGDVPGWDSVMHVSLVEALESKFSIKISMDEMIEMESVESVLNVLNRHLSH